MAEQNENFMLRWYDEVWNKGNESAIDEMMHPHMIAYGLSEGETTAEKFKAFYQGFKEKFSDIHITVEKDFVDGKFLTALCTVTAKHKATGKDVKFTGSATTELEDGKIVKAWNNFDFLTMFAQLGAVDTAQLVY